MKKTLIAALLYANSIYATEESPQTTAPRRIIPTEVAPQDQPAQQGYVSWFLERLIWYVEEAGRGAAEAVLEDRGFCS